MKQRTFLFTLLIFLSGVFVQSQTLENSIWFVNNSSGTYIGYFVFRSDTLFFGHQYMNINTPWGTYKEKGDSISFIDFGQRCSVSDIGEYTFNINNDTVKYDLIKDSCEQRKINLLNFYWVRIPLGITEVNSSGSIIIFPNPTRGNVSVLSKTIEITGAYFELYNLQGDRVFYLRLSSEITEIDLVDLPKGIYCYQITIEKETKKSGKLVLNKDQ